jgi:hypothetical protein
MEQEGLLRARMLDLSMTPRKGFDKASGVVFNQEMSAAWGCGWGPFSFAGGS